MTYRERKAARMARRLDWAASRDQKARAGFEKARRIADGIPLGQPILVGHHSEKRHRADLGRIDAGMRQGVESQDMAAKHRSTAAEIERQLDRSIYNDDANATEALEARIAELEEKRSRMALVNKLYRKGDAAGLAALGLDFDTLKAKLTEAGPYWGKQPHLAYELSNLGGRISSDRKRLADLKAQHARAQAAEQAGGVAVAYSSDRAWVSLTFAEKPDRPVLDALRGAGFRWGAGHWGGYTEKVPGLVWAYLSDLGYVREGEPS